MTDWDDVTVEMQERSRWGETRTDRALRIALRILRGADTAIGNLRSRATSAEGRLTSLEARVTALEPAPTEPTV